MPDSNQHPTPEGEQPEPSATTRRKDRATTSGSSASPASDDGARRKVHIVLQGKGGVGKTYISSLIAQYLKDKGEPVACLDTDPVNASFAAIPALEATPVDLLVDDRINVDALDGMVERLLSEDKNFIIDNGAASFVPLSRYLIENDIPGLITAGGKGVVVHTVITGGPALLETAKALAAMIEQLPENVELVVWVNAFFGPVITESGQEFEQTPLYQEHRDRITGVVRLDELNPDTFGHNLADMLGRRLTFAEAEQSPEFRVVAKQRLRQIRQPIWNQMAHVL